MRNTEGFESVDPTALAGVTGGCKKKQPKMQAQAQMQMAMAPAPAPDPGPRAEVTVATGAAGGQAIQQALSGGFATA